VLRRPVEPATENGHRLVPDPLSSSLLLPNAVTITALTVLCPQNWNAPSALPVCVLQWKPFGGILPMAVKRVIDGVHVVPMGLANAFLI
jgi:hypothetical protein